MWMNDFGSSHPIFERSDPHGSTEKASPDVPDVLYQMFVSNTVSREFTSPSNF